MKFDSISKYCINLEKRPERKISVSKEFDRIGIKVEFRKAVDGTKISIPLNCMKYTEYNVSGIIGCLLSHIELIRYAKESDQQYICVFEDDIELCLDFKKRISLIEEFALDFDMFYLGGHFHGNDIKATDYEYIFKAKGIAGTYAYIMRNTIFDYILDHFSYNWGIDQFYAEVIQKKFKCYAFIPFLVDHKDGISDVAFTRVNYPLTHKNYRSEL